MNPPEAPQPQEPEVPALVRAQERLSRLVLGAPFELPPGRLTEEKLRAYEAQLVRDEVFHSYAQLSARNVAAMARQRLRQKAAGSPLPERADIGYKMRFYDKYPSLIAQDLSLFQQYLAKRSAYGLRNDPELDGMEARALQYFGGLVAVVRHRLVIGNYNFVRTPEQRAKGNDALRRSTEEELREMQWLTRIAPASAETGPLPASLRVSDIAQAPRNQRERDGQALLIQQAILLADHNVYHYLSYAKDLPGIDPQEEGASPVRLLYVTTLMRALGAAKKEANVARCKQIAADIGAYLEQTGSTDIETLIRDLDHYTFSLKLDEQTATGKPEKPPPTQAERYIEREVDARIKGFQQHFHEIESSVLRIGWKERLEQAWSKGGRAAVLVLEEAYAAMHALPNTIARAQGRKLTDKLPAILGEPIQWGIGKLAGSSREEIMGGIREGLELPKDFDLFDPEHWRKLKPEEIQRVRDKMRSVVTVIEARAVAIRERIAAVNADFAALQQLRSAHHPDTLVDIDADPMAFPAGTRVTAQDIRRVQTKTQAVALYERFFEQLQRDWKGYSSEVSAMVGDFEEVMRDHLNMQRQFLEAAEKLDRDYLMWILMAGGGVAAAWLLGTKSGRGTLRLGARGVAGTARLASRGVRAGVGAGASAMRGAPEATNLARAGRILGHLGFVFAEGLTLYEIQDQIRRNMEMQKLEGQELADAALEFWKGERIPGVPGKPSLKDDGRADQWKDEVLVLERRCDIEAMRTILAGQTLPTDEDIGSRKDAVKLKDELDVLRKQRKHLEEQLSVAFKVVDEELPISNVFAKRPGHEGYGVNVSGSILGDVIPSPPLVGGPLESARESGRSNRFQYGEAKWTLKRHGERMALSYLEGVGIKGDDADQLLFILKKCPSAEELERHFLDYQRACHRFVMRFEGR